MCVTSSRLLAGSTRDMGFRRFCTTAPICFGGGIMKSCRGRFTLPHTSQWSLRPLPLLIMVSDADARAAQEGEAQTFTHTGIYPAYTDATLRSGARGLVVSFSTRRLDPAAGGGAATGAREKRSGATGRSRAIGASARASSASTPPAAPSAGRAPGRRPRIADQSPPRRRRRRRRRQIVSPAGMLGPAPKPENPLFSPPPRPGPKQSPKPSPERSLSQSRRRSQRPRRDRGGRRRGPPRAREKKSSLPCR